MNHFLNLPGNLSEQIKWDNLGGKYALGDLIEVTDLKTALAAIDQIVKEGEGSSPCNPFNFYKGEAQLSHYFLFKCVVEKHQLRVHLDQPTPPKDKKDAKKDAKKDGYLSEVRHRPTFKFE